MNAPQKLKKFELKSQQAAVVIGVSIDVKTEIS